MVFLMFISFGFSLPLLILLMVEILWGVILMTPPPFNIPAIKLAELTYTPTGKTVGKECQVSIDCKCPMY
jgi:hypothetical protein